MKIQAAAKYGVIALVLVLAGFLGAVGIATLLFTPSTGTFSPTTSSDVAAWIQAIGSIVAIGAAYSLGERQARRARDQALEIYHLQRERVEAGARGVVAQLYAEVMAVDYAAHKLQYDAFVEMWQRMLLGTCQAAIDAFDHLPRHELGQPRKVSIGFELRGNLIHTMAQISAVIDRSYASGEIQLERDQINVRQFEEGRRVLELRGITSIALERQAELRLQFDGLTA